MPKCKLPNYLLLHPVLAHYRRCCTMPCRRNYLQSCSLHFNKYELLHFSKDGLKAQKEYSPEQRSGYSWPSILRSERAKGRRKRADSKQFCWYMGMCSFFLLGLQRASLFIHLYPERCSGLYSCWGSAPSLLKYKYPYYLQLRPVLARNIYCTISWTMFLLRLRPAFAHYRCCCIIPCRGCYLPSCSLHFNKYELLHFSKDGLKAQKEYSPEQRSGYSWPSILRSERAKGRKNCANCKQFCWYMGMVSFFLLRLQRASLLMHLYPERCSGLYSCWGFAPSLLKCDLPIICSFAPSLLVT